jgi:hypothetical protein
MKGYVYVFKMIGTNFYKIGMTNSDSVKSRLDNFRVFAPNGVEVIQVISTKNTRVLEKELHVKFHSKRMKGEFFNLDENDLIYLECLQDEKVNELKNFFWTYIFDNNFNIDSVKKLFINEYDNLSENKSKNEIVINYVNDYLAGNELTCTEVKKLIFETLNIEINTKNLGSILKSNYTQKMKKIEGSNQRVYLL